MSSLNIMRWPPCYKISFVWSLFGLTYEADTSSTEKNQKYFKHNMTLMPNNLYGLCMDTVVLTHKKRKL